MSVCWFVCLFVCGAGRVYIAKFFLFVRILCWESGSMTSHHTNFICVCACFEFVSVHCEPSHAFEDASMTLTAGSRVQNVAQVMMHATAGFLPQTSAVSSVGSIHLTSSGAVLGSETRAGTGSGAPHLLTDATSCSPGVAKTFAPRSPPPHPNQPGIPEIGARCG